MRIDLVSGWAYPPAALEPLDRALRPEADVIIHPFTRMPEPPARRGKAKHLLAGWSLGGLKALKAVADGTWKPDGLILISATARFCAEGDYIHGPRKAALRAMMAGMRGDHERVLADFFLRAGRSAGIIDSCYSKEQLLEGLQDLDQLDLRPLLSSVSIPVLLLHGAHDMVIPPGASRHLAGHLPAATLEINHHAGHTLPLEEPEWVARHISAFAATALEDRTTRPP